MPKTRTSASMEEEVVEVEMEGAGPLGANPVDYSNKKQNLASRAVRAARSLLDSIREFQSVRQEVLDNGFAPAPTAGQANPMVDADFPAQSELRHLTAQIFLDGMTAANTVDTTLAANARDGYKKISALTGS
jgi:hypothetical protein